MLTLENSAGERFEVLHELLLSLPVRYVKSDATGYTFQVAEIGVRRGETAQYLLDTMPDIHMYVIDPYLPYDDGLNLKFTAEDQAAFKKEMFSRLSPFEGRYRFLEEKSVVAANRFNPNFFDLVFIDGEHTYAAVKEDIAAWYPLVNYGGILSGHDYSMAEIKKAVVEFGEFYCKPVWHSDPNSDVWAFQK